MLNIDLLDSKPRLRGVSNKKAALKLVLIVIGVSLLLAIVAVFSYRLVFKLIAIEKFNSSQMELNKVEQDKIVPPQHIQEIALADDISLVLVPYTKLTDFEKIRYEIQSVYRILYELKEMSPNAIDFKNIKIEDYHKISANCNVLEKVTTNQLLERIMNNSSWSLIKPSTKITQENNYYNLVFSAEHIIGPNLLKQSFFEESNVLPFSQLQEMKEKLATTLNSCGLTVLDDFLKNVSHDVSGDFKQYVYRFSVKGDFVDILRFVNFMYETGMAISFPFVELKCDEKLVVADFEVKMVVR